MNKKNDPHKLSPRESHLCVTKLLEGVQNAKYHGDIKLRFRDGELFHIECTQSALPKAILEEKFLCVLLRSKEDAEVPEETDAPQAHPQG